MADANNQVYLESGSVFIYELPGHDAVQMWFRYSITVSLTRAQARLLATAHECPLHESGRREPRLAIGRARFFPLTGFPGRWSFSALSGSLEYSTSLSTDEKEQIITLLLREADKEQVAA